MILHVVGDEPKFIIPFVKYINKEFPVNDHLFLISNCQSENLDKYREFDNVIIIRPLDNKRAVLRKMWMPYKFLASQISLLILAKQAKKVIFHGLFDTKVILSLYVNKWMIKKSSWVIWGGGDLDEKKQETNSIFTTIKRKVKGSFAEYITYIKEDYDRCVEFYAARGRLTDCLMYESNVIPSSIVITVSNDIKQHNQPTRLLVGNSADVENNQIEILKRLEQYKSENIEIYVPLSYGLKPWAPNWIEDVCRCGRTIFGNKFIPLLNFMPLDEYRDLLAKMDIAIFDHKYQQGMGNIIYLLGVGKKVYIRAGIPSYEMFIRLGLQIYDNSNLDISPLSMRDALNNNSIIMSKFTSESLRAQLGSLLQ